jgi:isopentenyldiphosphate isomerase
MPSTSLEKVVDVVDSRNRRTGSAKRRELLPKNLNFRTVHIFVIDQDGKLILQKLRPDHPRNPTRLGSSVAGHLHTGERYASAARRKLKDELRLQLPVKRIGVFTMVDEKSKKFVGLFTSCAEDQNIAYDKEQIDSITRMSFKEIEADIKRQPLRYTPTFLKAYEFFRSQGFSTS